MVVVVEAFEDDARDTESSLPITKPMFSSDAAVSIKREEMRWSSSTSNELAETDLQRDNAHGSVKRR